MAKSQYSDDGPSDTPLSKPLNGPSSVHSDGWRRWHWNIASAGGVNCLHATRFLVEDSPVSTAAAVQCCCLVVPCCGGEAASSRPRSSHHAQPSTINARYPAVWSFGQAAATSTGARDKMMRFGSGGTCRRCCSVDDVTCGMSWPTEQGHCWLKDRRRPFAGETFAVPNWGR